MAHKDGYQRKHACTQLDQNARTHTGTCTTVIVNIYTGHK